MICIAAKWLTGFFNWFAFYSDSIRCPKKTDWLQF